ncbi:MAG: hypothetical protein CVV27_02950 [Candidatus Melainabacteria bacterium HGW-Melainabacteria-1]|nr:MAG: hypothetical protein CVV27_02950 [Candidatus Melainabacteria bacterium HGW-Melainabacteria-1]
MQLSVIVLTSPGREANLRACLSALAGQTQPPNQLIVVDDGSAGGEAIATASGLKLDYLWRVNDGNRSRGRNLGAQAARCQGLVFVDGDMILNPHALAYYRLYLQQLPTAAVFGYHGNLCTPTTLCPSAWIPGLQVHVADERFPYATGQNLRVHPHLSSRPQDFAWSASFALPAALFEAVGGFDADRFGSWGFEDLDFGYRLVNAGVALHFSLDVWAEACPHPRAWTSEADKTRNLGLITPLRREPQPAAILHDPRHSSLLKAWQTVYAPSPL